MRYLLFFFASAFLFACQSSDQAENSHLGTVEFSFTANERAQPLIKEGWLLLHSFEYEDARTVFRQTQEADALCPMAYWGEAMSHHYALWEREDYEDGVTALAKWEEFSAGKEISMSAIEQGLLQAAAVLYGEGSRIERNQAYADAMEKLYDAYPKSHEVGSIYALSLLGSVPEGRDFERYGQAASIAQSILKENPQHPGALHYLIHAYDDPEHATMALDAAFAYAKVAPDAAHALHMPSHIFVARGMWDNVVNSNIASYGASVDRKERLKMNNNARSYHALAWLMYGLLQQSRIQEVDAIMEDMIKYATETPSVPARSYLTGMIATYFVYTENQQSPFLDVAANTEDLSVSLQALSLFTKGLRSYSAKEATGIESAIQGIKTATARAKNSLVEGNSAVCGAPSAYSPPTQIDIEIATVMQLELQGLLATLNGETAKAEAFLQQAASLEASTDYEYGPPTIVKPAHELYADWLLAQARPEEALAEYELAELRTPNRLLIHEGRELAFRLSGKVAEADSVRDIILHMQQPEHPEIAYLSK